MDAGQGASGLELRREAFAHVRLRSGIHMLRVYRRFAHAQIACAGKLDVQMDLGAAGPEPRSFDQERASVQQFANSATSS